MLFADKTEEVRRLGMGRLLNDISNKMQRKVERGEKDPLKLLVHSTHDTAIAALCSTLDVYDEKYGVLFLLIFTASIDGYVRWPAFTASITVELFKKNPDQEPASLLQTMMSPFKAKTSPEHCAVELIRMIP